MKYLWMLYAHYIADYVLQTDYLAKTKKDSLYSLFVHSFIYAMTITAFLFCIDSFAAWKTAALISTHMATDYIKATRKMTTYLYAENKRKEKTYLFIDQSLHIIINLLMMWS